MVSKSLAPFSVLTPIQLLLTVLMLLCLTENWHSPFPSYKKILTFSWQQFRINFLSSSCNAFHKVGSECSECTFSFTILIKISFTHKILIEPDTFKSQKFWHFLFLPQIPLLNPISKVIDPNCAVVLVPCKSSTELTSSDRDNWPKWS